jgi:hypothetical protein
MAMNNEGDDGVPVNMDDESPDDALVGQDVDGEAAVNLDDDIEPIPHTETIEEDPADSEEPDGPAVQPTTAEQTAPSTSTSDEIQPPPVAEEVEPDEDTGLDGLSVPIEPDVTEPVGQANGDTLEEDSPIEPSAESGTLQPEIGATSDVIVEEETVTARLHIPVVGSTDP